MVMVQRNISDVTLAIHVQLQQCIFNTAELMQMKLAMTQKDKYISYTTDSANENAKST